MPEHQSQPKGGGPSGQPSLACAGAGEPGPAAPAPGAEVQGLPLPVYTWQRMGADFCLVDYNDAAAAYTDGAVARLLGAKAGTLYGDTPDILELFEQCYRERRPVRREMLYRFRSGRGFRYLSVAFGFLPPDRVLVVTDDAQQRMETEEALRRAHDDLDRRVQQRTAELDHAYRALHAIHEQERLVNALLRLSMEEIPLAEQLERALGLVLDTPWLPAERQGGIFLADPASKVLELRAFRHLDAGVRSGCARVPFGTCLCGRAASSRQIEFARSADAPHELRHPEVVPHANLCVPVLAGDRVVATLLLYVGADYERNPDHDEFLQVIAHALGGLVERKRAETERDAGLAALRRGEAQLLELNERLAGQASDLERMVAARTREIDRRRAVAASLRDVLALLNSGRPAGEVLDQIVSEAGRLLGSDTAALYRHDAAEPSFPLLTAQGALASQVVDWAFPPGLSQALHEGRAWPAADLTQELAPCEAGDCGVRRLLDCCSAVLAVPLLAAGELYGGLLLFYGRPRAFSDDEVGLAMAYADQAALALENARLSEQAQRAAVLGERSRLARELHDSVTQSLYSLTLLAEGWKRLEAAGRLDTLERPLAEIGAIAQQALKEMRLLVHELRPPDLEKVGLPGALHLRLGAVEKRAGIEARLVAEELPDLPHDVEEGLYRIAVEALNNALKHAEATSLTVHLHMDEDSAVLEVQDNGRGFDPGGLAQRRGLGATSMRERAERLGGRLEIDSAPGRGTRVTVRVPVPGRLQGVPGGPHSLDGRATEESP